MLFGVVDVRLDYCGRGCLLCRMRNIEVVVAGSDRARDWRMELEMYMNMTCKLEPVGQNSGLVSIFKK